jgi:hypothetical protein
MRSIDLLAVLGDIGCLVGTLLDRRRLNFVNVFDQSVGEC